MRLFVVVAIASQFVLGCGHAKNVDVLASATQVEKMPIRAGLKDDSLVIVIPIIRKENSQTSPLSLRINVVITRPGSVGAITAPNAIILGIRTKW